MNYLENIEKWAFFGKNEYGLTTTWDIFSDIFYSGNNDPWSNLSKPDAKIKPITWRPVTRFFQNFENLGWNTWQKFFGFFCLWGLFWGLRNLFENIDWKNSVWFRFGKMKYFWKTRKIKNSRIFAKIDFFKFLNLRELKVSFLASRRLVTTWRSF